jgi:hypothetical protein
MDRQKQMGNGSIQVAGVRREIQRREKEIERVREDLSLFLLFAVPLTLSAYLSLCMSFGHWPSPFLLRFLFLLRMIWLDRDEGIVLPSCVRTTIQRFLPGAAQGQQRGPKKEKKKKNLIGVSAWVALTQTRFCLRQGRATIFDFFI